jgi:hypothetical protein
LLPLTFKEGADHRRRSASRVRSKARWPSRSISTPWKPDRAMSWLRHLADHMSTSASEIPWHGYHRSIGQAWFAPFVLLSSMLTATAFAVLSILSSAHLPAHGFLHLATVVTGVWALLSGPFIFALLRQFRYEPYADSISGLSFLAGTVGALSVSPAEGLGTRLALGCQIWAAAATLLQFGFRLRQRLRPRYLSPDKALRAAGHHALINTSCVSIAFWLLIAILPSTTNGGFTRFFTMADGDIMLTSGSFSLIVTTSLVTTHWGAFMSARLMSSAKGLLPFRLAQFLADASRMGILVRIGSSYYFKHADLRDFLQQA